VGGITLHGFDEIGDEIVAALELHIDVRQALSQVTFSRTRLLYIETAKITRRTRIPER